MERIVEVVTSISTKISTNVVNASGPSEESRSLQQDPDKRKKDLLEKLSHLAELGVGDTPVTARPKHFFNTQVASSNDLPVVHQVPPNIAQLLSIAQVSIGNSTSISRDGVQVFKRVLTKAAVADVGNVTESGRL